MPAKTPAKPSTPSRRRTPRRPVPEPVRLRPRLVEDDLLVDPHEHAARDAHLLDLLDRISA